MKESFEKYKCDCHVNFKKSGIINVKRPIARSKIVSVNNNWQNTCSQMKTLERSTIWKTVFVSDMPLVLLPEGIYKQAGWQIL